MGIVFFDQQLEEIIHKAQKWSCAITATELGVPNGDDMIKEVFSDANIYKLLAYGLIEKDEKKPGIFPLTEKGLHFKSFAECKKEAERESYLKRNAYWRAKYWWVFTIAGFIIGSILTPILLEEWKTHRQSQPKTETTTKFENKKTNGTSQSK